jgi:hypothetical protein
MSAPPSSASRYYAASAYLAAQTAAEALAVRSRGARAAWLALARGQIRQSNLAEIAVDTMLSEQEIDSQAEALLNSSAFTTEVARFEAMIEEVKVDAEFERLVASITQDAGRAAQEVAIVARPNIAHVRHLNLPSCSRCVVLAGRVYRYSIGFLRHPGCDCVMIPTAIANDDLAYDPVELARDGQIRGLSRADLKAIAGGADYNKLVNTKQRNAGLFRPGDTIGSGPAVEDLIAAANGRGAALDALVKAAYFR